MEGALYWLEVMEGRSSLCHFKKTEDAWVLETDQSLGIMNTQTTSASE